MPLKLRYLARARLWAEVVVSHGDRVFVPTPEVLLPGSVVSLEIEAPELSAPLSTTATVLEVRPLSATAPGGLLVRLDEASLEKCRAAVAGRDEAARVAGRTEARVDCELPARVLAPTPMGGCAVKSLSAHGLTLKTPQPLPADAAVSMVVQLPDASELPAAAQVMWTRAELSLAGLRLTGLDATAAARLAAAVAALQGRAPRAGASSHTVLVADDDPSILDFTSRVIAKAGHRVLRAERGDLALELARKERPALVLLDVLMPGLDGLEVCQALRADAALARTPVLMMSAMGEGKLATATRECGADGYLTKPMRLEALRALLAEKLKA